MDSHLVTVKVGVKGSTHQWMQLNRLTFNQGRFKSLNTQAVQGWCTVQQHRMLTNDFFENIPNLWHFLFNQFLGRLDGRSHSQHFQLVEDKGLEQLQGHFLRQTALMQTQGWANGNHGTTGVVNAFTQQVLTETTAFTFNHVCQRLQRTLVSTSHRFTATAVIEQRIHRFLQHAFFVTHDDFWRFQLQQTLQTVVTVDNAAIQVVQIGSGKAATIQRHQWAQFGW